MSEKDIELNTVPTPDEEVSVYLPEQEDEVLNSHIHKLLHGTEKEREKAREAIIKEYQPIIASWVGSRFRKNSDEYNDTYQATIVALLIGMENFDPGKVNNGRSRNYFNKLVSAAIKDCLSTMHNRTGAVYSDDVKKVEGAVKNAFDDDEKITVLSVKNLILEKKIRKSEHSAEELAKAYIHWRQPPKDIDINRISTVGNYRPRTFPEYSYLELKEQLNTVFSKRDSADIGQMDDRELERTAQKLSIDYNELLYLREQYSKKNGNWEVSDQTSFLLSIAPYHGMIDALVHDPKFRDQFEQQYRVSFDMDDFCLDSIGVPNDSASENDINTFLNEYNTYIRHFNCVPVFRNNYLSARKKLTGNMLRAKFQSDSIITPLDFLGEKYSRRRFPFTDFNDAEKDFLLNYLHSAFSNGSNDIYTNTYLAMLLLSGLLQGHEGENLRICDLTGVQIFVTKESLLKYAERSFYADYSSGSVDGYLGAMIYAISSEMFAEGPVKSRLFLVKQIFEQIDRNGTVHDAYSYIEEDLYDLYFSVCRDCETQHFTFSEYIENRAMRYDISQVWEVSDNKSLEKIIMSDRKRRERDESGEAYRLYKDSLLMLLENSKLQNGMVSGSALSFNLLIHDLAYPFRPLSTVVKSCFREKEFIPMLTYYTERAQSSGITLDNQNVAFLYCMQNNTRYLGRLAVLLVAHHFTDTKVIENYQTIIESE